jgi:helix-turn-helix, Psq domain
MLGGFKAYDWRLGRRLGQIQALGRGGLWRRFSGQTFRGVASPNVPPEAQASAAAGASPQRGEKSPAVEAPSGGMSQRKAAEALGIPKSTLHDDVSGSRTQGVRFPDASDRDERREAAIVGNEALAAVEVAPAIAKGRSKGGRRRKKIKGRPWEAEGVSRRTWERRRQKKGSSRRSPRGPAGATAAS